MKKYMIFLLIWVLYGFTPRTYARDGADSLRILLKEVQERVRKLEKKQEEAELRRILQEAEAESADEEKELKEKTFRSGQRSLQAVNPEISVTGDMYGMAVANADAINENGRSGAFLRVVGLHIQSNLDPFSLAKIALEATPDGLEIGEIYATWTNFTKNISLTGGKFRQQFGVVNRWHAHGLDQFDFPLALTTIFGPEGLNQIGVSFDWLMPRLTADANTLTLQITNGQNEQLFGGEEFSAPAVLAHLKNYYDLAGHNAYLEIGLTGMWGRNDQKTLTDEGAVIREEKRNTWLGGIDITYRWEPLDEAMYRSLIWRSELYFAQKDSLDGVSIRTLGGYSYLQYRLNERLFFGVRADYTQPFVSGNEGLYSWQVVPYVTWWQSHWVRFRLQYNHLEGNAIAGSSDIIRLQLTFAMGPHKHERY